MKRQHAQHNGAVIHQQPAHKIGSISECLFLILLTTRTSRLKLKQATKY